MDTPLRVNANEFQFVTCAIPDSLVVKTLRWKRRDLLSNSIHARV